MDISLIYTELQKEGFRLTRSRRAVIEAMARAESCMRPEDVLLRAQESCPSLGLVTVYRTLRLLSELGHVRRVHFDNGCHGYAPSALTHGHHIICRNCQQVIEFPGSEAIGALIAQVEGQTGFAVEDHLLELMGLCPACRDS